MAVQRHSPPLRPHQRRNLPNYVPHPYSHPSRREVRCKLSGSEALEEEGSFLEWGTRRGKTRAGQLKGGAEVAARSEKGRGWWYRTGWGWENSRHEVSGGGTGRGGQQGGSAVQGRRGSWRNHGTAAAISEDFDSKHGLGTEQHAEPPPQRERVWDPSHQVRNRALCRAVGTTIRPLKSYRMEQSTFWSDFPTLPNLCPNSRDSAPLPGRDASPPLGGHGRPSLL